LATYLSHVRNLVDLFLNSIFGGFFLPWKTNPNLFSNNISLGLTFDA
jgi:hypothetical protein